VRFLALVAAGREFLLAPTATPALTPFFVPDFLPTASADLFDFDVLVDAFFVTLVVFVLGVAFLAPFFFAITLAAFFDVVEPRDGFSCATFLFTRDGVFLGARPALAFVFLTLATRVLRSPSVRSL